jgi:hypothetical protein
MNENKFFLINTFFNNRACAIKDCSVFNNYFNSMRCVV